MGFETEFEDSHGVWERYKAKRLIEGRARHRKFTIFHSFYQFLIIILLMLIMFSWILPFGMPGWTAGLDAVRFFAEVVLAGITMWLITVWYFLTTGYWLCMGTLGVYPIDSFDPFRTYMAEWTGKDELITQEIRSCGVIGGIKKLFGYDGGKGWGFFDCLLASRVKGKGDHRFDKMVKYVNMNLVLRPGQRRGSVLDIPMDFTRKHYRSVKSETLIAVAEHDEYRLYSPIYIADDPLPSQNLPSSKPSEYQRKMDTALTQLWESRKDNDRLATAYSRLAKKMSRSVPKDIKLKYEEE